MLGLRFMLGIAGAAVIYIGFKFILPGKDSFFSDATFLEPFYEIGRFIRYCLLGLWASAGAPKCFLNLGLADSSAEVPRPEE